MTTQTDFEERQTALAKVRQEYDLSETQMEELGFRDILLVQKPRILKLFPRKANVDRHINSFMVYYKANPALWKCTHKSLFSCFLNAVELDLDFNKVRGWAYIIVFNTKNKETGRYEDIATFITGYKGFIELITRGGRVKKVEAKVAYEGDEFYVEEGSEPKIIHRPCLDDSRTDKVIAAYAIATLKNGERQQEVVMYKDLEKVRKTAKTQKIWGDWKEEMQRKTSVRRLIKYLPISEEVTYALEIDNQLTQLEDVPDAGSPEAIMDNLIQQEKEADPYDASDKMAPEILAENQEIKDEAVDAEVSNVEHEEEKKEEMDLSDKKAKGEQILKDLEEKQKTARKKNMDKIKKKNKPPQAPHKEEPLPEINSDDVTANKDDPFLPPVFKGKADKQGELNL